MKPLALLFVLLFVYFVAGCTSTVRYTDGRWTVDATATVPSSVLGYVK